MANSPDAASLNTLFGCVHALCSHYDVAMPLTPEALEGLVAERKGLAAAETALTGAGFDVSRTPLTADTVRSPSPTFPVLAERRRGGYVLIVGTKAANGEELVGVFDPGSGETRARAWTPDLVARSLIGEALHAVPARGGRRSRELEATVTTPRSPTRRTQARRYTMPDIYADALENILVHGGTVRIDLATYSPREKSVDDRPVLEPTGRLVMPIEGFVRAFGGIREVVRRLAEDGVIEPVERPGGRPAES